MREYTFVRDSGDKIIEARSLKKAIKKYTPEKEKYVQILWTSKKGNKSTTLLKIPYITRKERKGKL
jgi:hypothetical protein|tara:strand:- start:456 stop:653 length:198 start_codon:yes stop_codon:yes gene_type:complete